MKSENTARASVFVADENARLRALCLAQGKELAILNKVIVRRKIAYKRRLSQVRREVLEEASKGCCDRCYKRIRALMDKD